MLYSKSFIFVERKCCDICCAVISQLEDVKAEMQDMKKYDTMQVVMTQEANQRLKRDLNQCRNGLRPIIQPTQPQHGKSQKHAEGAVRDNITL